MPIRCGRLPNWLSGARRPAGLGASAGAAPGPDRGQARPLLSRPGASRGGYCGGCPAGGPCPVQPDGCGGRDQGGAEGDRGDLPARHAAGADRVNLRRTGAGPPKSPGGGTLVANAAGEAAVRASTLAASPAGVISSRSRALSVPDPGAAGWDGLGSVSIRAYSAAVSRLIAAPRCSAARVRPAPIACWAWRSGASRPRAPSGQSRTS
jgi:hypothetical protein